MARCGKIPATVKCFERAELPTGLRLALFGCNAKCIHILATVAEIACRVYPYLTRQRKVLCSSATVAYSLRRTKPTTMKTQTLEQKLEAMLPDWPAFNIQFHGLWRDDGGWSVNDSWTAYREATREETIGHLRARWEVFKLNYLPKARVRDLTDAGIDNDDDCLLEVDCTAFATIRNSKNND